MSRRGRNSQSGSRSNSSGKLALWIVAAVLLVGAWVTAVVALGGVEQDRSGDGEPDNRGEQQANKESQRDGASTKDGSGGDGDGSGSGERQEVADDVLSERPGGGVPEGAVAIEDEEGRSNGQRGFVSSFIGGAYGYTGDDVEEYRSSYEGYIDASTYYDSPGEETLRYYASLVEDGGAENAAVLKDYTILSGEAVDQQVSVSELNGFAPRQLMRSEVPEGATVSEVTYAVGDRYADPGKGEDFGDVYGDVEYLKQRLFLTREEGGEGWKVLAAGSPQATEDPQAGQPPAGANKVGEPKGPGTAGHDH